MFLLMLENKEIQVEADAKDLPKTYAVKGSEEARLFKELTDKLNKMQAAGMGLQQRFSRVQNNPDSVKNRFWFTATYLLCLTILKTNRLPATNN